MCGADSPARRRCLWFFCLTLRLAGTNSKRSRQTATKINPKFNCKGGGQECPPHTFTLRDRFPALLPDRPLRLNGAGRCELVHRLREESRRKKRTPRGGRAGDATRSWSS